MTIGREDATRIVRFCLAGVGWGIASHEDNLCVLKIARSGAIGTEVVRFEADSFEGALRQAAESGALKKVCLDKQIAFLARSLPARHPGVDDDVGGETSREKTASEEALFPEITAAISALVHETQRERGTSSLYLSSQGKLLADEMHAQWRSTDARRTDLLILRRRHAASLPTALARKLELSDDLVGALTEGRATIAKMAVDPAQVIDRYSRTNSELLSVIDGLAQRGVDAALRPTALAWMALLHAKEKTGIERAQLATAFTWDRYSDGQHATVSALIAASESYLHIFVTAAPRKAGDLLREQLRSDVVNAVSEMEKVALSKREGGFGIDPTAWFANMSRKMDMLTDVESAVQSALTHPGR